MKTYEKWRVRIIDHDTPWTENEIIYFRKAIGQCGMKDPVQRASLRNLFFINTESIYYRITDEQSERGRDYLLSKSLKLNGERRTGCKLDSYELNVLRNLDHHLFVGLECSTAGLAHYFPVYRAVSKTGDSFDYVGATYSQMEVLSRSIKRLRVV